MRQGCPVSQLLYIIQAEPLACAIRGNDKIIGFPLPYTYPDNDKPTEANMVSYVDDAQVFNSTEQSIVECFSVIKQFENSSGAIVHKGKTTGLYIGPGKIKPRSSIKSNGLKLMLKLWVKYMDMTSTKILFGRKKSIKLKVVSKCGKNAIWL